jgi:hypothetical protein
VVEHLGRARIALRTLDGTYLSRGRDDGAGILCDAPVRGERETFAVGNPFDVG